MNRLRRTGELRRISGSVQLLRYSLAVALTLLAVRGAQGQEPTLQIRVPGPGETQELVLRDGSVLYGQVIDAGDPVTFRLLSGTEVTIPRSGIRSLRLAEGEVVEGEFWGADPNRTRLFFGPTARSLPKGEGYLAVYELVMPFLGFALTDHFILAGGTPLFFGGGGSRPFWLAPKLTFLDWGHTQVAAGVLALAWEDETAGILYGVLTRGNGKRSMTVGLGYGFVNDDLADTPAVMFGAELRGGRHTLLVTENYIFPGGDGIISAGPRFFGERLSADLGLAVPLGVGELVAFPLVNFVWNF